MIECKGLSLTYRKKQLLCGVDFCAHSGKITALLGQNGSGKTTLLRCLAGTRHHAQGEILVQNQPLSRLSPRERAQRIGLMPQILARPEITVQELVSMAYAPWVGYAGRLSAQQRQEVLHTMQRTGIFPLREQLVSRLSGGERQLAYFTLLLCQHTPVLLLDEPTASLDAARRSAVYQTLQELRREGRTIVLALHDLADAVQLADVVTVLQHGQVAFTGTAEEFIASDLPRRAFSLRPVRVQDGAQSFTVFRPLPTQQEDESGAPR